MVVPNEEPKKPTKPKKPAKPRKSRERSLPVPVPASAAGLSVINPDAAGIDVHSNMHMVCVPADRDANPVRQFGANTADLQEIGAWLKKCRIKLPVLPGSSGSTRIDSRRGSRPDDASDLQRRSSTVVRQAACTLGPKLDQGKQFGKLDQPFGFLLLGGRKWRALILAIEQFLKPGVHSGRQPEPRQVVGDLKFDRDHSGHDDPHQCGFQTSSYQAGHRNAFSFTTDSGGVKRGAWGERIVASRQRSRGESW